MKPRKCQEFRKENNTNRLNRMVSYKFHDNIEQFLFTRARMSVNRFLQSIFNLLRICCRSFDAAKCICRHTVWNESVPRESELTWKGLSKVADEFPYTLSRAWKFLNITCWQPNWVSSYLPVWIWDRDDHVPFQWTCIRLSTWDNELTCRANIEQSSRNIGEWRWGGGGGYRATFTF